MNTFWVAVDPSEFDLVRCVTSGQTFRWIETSPGVWTGVDGPDIYRVSIVGARLTIETNTNRKAFERLFRLEVDAQQLQRDILKVAPELEAIMTGLAGLRVMAHADATETLFSFLCTPNNHMSRIGPMVRNLATLGQEIGFDQHRFPIAEVVAAIPQEQLRAKGFGYRAATIPAAAREIVQRGGERYVQNLRQIGYEEAMRELITIPNIGRKLADCIALFGLHYTEALPVDTHIWQAATRHYFPEWQDSALTEKKYRAVGDFMRDKFGLNTGWVQQFLFLDNAQNWRTRKGKG